MVKYKLYFILFLRRAVAMTAFQAKAVLSLPTMMNETAKNHLQGLPKKLSDWFGLFFVLGLVYLLFSFRGNDSHAIQEGRSLLRWIAHQWTLPGGDFAHGWIMPLVSVAVIYRQRHAIASATKQPSLAGGALLACSLALHWASYRAQQPRISLIALTGVLWSTPFFLYGWQVAKLLLFPAGYLLLCFTSYFLVELTLPLRLAASRLSVVVLQGLGIAAVRRGTAIFSAAGGGFQFDVADACSGLRSLVVMTALAAPYAYFTLPGLWQRWLLFVLSVPLAMLANMLRIVTLALVAQFFGQELALKIYHDFSGYLVFIIAVLLLVSTGRLIEKTRTLLKWP